MLTDKLRRVEVLAHRLMHKHGLVGWAFGFNRRKTHSGLCKWKSRTASVGTIYLSIYFVQLNDWPEIEDILLHEIAHAIVGFEESHGPRWQAVAASIGAKPKPCNSYNMPGECYKARCPNCLRPFYRHRQVRGYKQGRKLYCANCGPKKGILAFARSMS